MEDCRPEGKRTTTVAWVQHRIPAGTERELCQVAIVQEFLWPSHTFSGKVRVGGTVLKPNIIHEAQGVGWGGCGGVG